MSNTPSDIQASIGIGITTKDRWDCLAVTLEKLRQHNLSGLETIVIDDGSNEPMPTVFRERFPWVMFERSENSRGYIAQRNRLAHLLTSQLYLSLDDDSYPKTNARLADAAAWLIGQQDAVALAFSIQSPSEEAEGLTRAAAPYPVRFYIGCAHMLKRELFCHLGGYTESLLHYGEEVDFALKAWKRGFHVYKYPSVVVFHDRSPIGRNAANANRLLTRNEIWISFWRSPYPILFVQLLIRVPKMLRYRTHRLQWKAVLQGYFHALFGAFRVAKYRDALSVERYCAWLRKPIERH
ncbi:MAG TPA: glycosyltransferase [Terrimicrobiaceae bacterium]